MDPGGRRVPFRHALHSRAIPCRDLISDGPKGPASMSELLMINHLLLLVRFVVVVVGGVGWVLAAPPRL